jgi:hypothetical protein
MHTQWKEEHAARMKQQVLLPGLHCCRSFPRVPPAMLAALAQVLSCASSAEPIPTASSSDLKRFAGGAVRAQRRGPAAAPSAAGQQRCEQVRYAPPACIHMLFYLTDTVTSVFLMRVDT